jgi:thymidylate synthase (FAD)
MISYMAMHQDYYSGLVFEQMGPANGAILNPLNPSKILTEREAGQIVVNRCLKFGHWGVIEHPQIVLNCGGFPHTMVQQLRTHRTGISFDVQSFRYTSKSIEDVADGLKDVETAFYIRPVGQYGRMGSSVFFQDYMRLQHRDRLEKIAIEYTKAVRSGMPYEMARDLFIPYSVIQNFVVSANLRTVLHLLDLRHKANAQLEIQKFSEKLFEIAHNWAPEILDFYKSNRLSKAKLSP